MADDTDDEEWCDIVADVPDFHFDPSLSGMKIDFGDSISTARESFIKLGYRDKMAMILYSITYYAVLLSNTNRPK